MQILFIFAVRFHKQQRNVTDWVKNIFSVEYMFYFSTYFGFLNENIHLYYVKMDVFLNIFLRKKFTKCLINLDLYHFSVSLYNILNFCFYIVYSFI